MRNVLIIEASLVVVLRGMNLGVFRKRRAKIVTNLGARKEHEGKDIMQIEKYSSHADWMKNDRLGIEARIEMTLDEHVECHGQYDCHR